MNEHEREQARLLVRREQATFRLEKTDRLVRRDWGMFAATRQRWLSEGWNGDPTIFQLDPSPYFPVNLVDLVGIDVPVSPQFEIKIIREDEHYVYQQTSAGAIEKFLHGTKRNDEAMPQYWRNPVTCIEDWEYKVKPRLDPDTPERWHHLYLAEEASAAIRDGVRLYEASAIGAYMYLRALLGPEEVLYTFYDNPDLIHDMMRTWLNLLKTCLLRIQAKVPFFKLLFGEDIAYKNGLLISPAMIDEFLTPYYLDLLQALSHGQADPIHFEIDSDGNMKEFLPIYMQMGFNVFRPFEIAANNNLVAIGSQYPGIVLCGGIDKRILGDSPAAIETYLQSIMPFFTKRGGYIPTCDHSVPSTVPFANYMYYRKRMIEMDGCGGFFPNV
ncbi:MAG: uroporphyrinogen decarboxylase family protein [Bacillota bacterium]|nr:uroporphyrinogen decarboxylase family protein [Bacillota bacterium]